MLLLEGPQLRTDQHVSMKRKLSKARETTMEEEEGEQITWARRVHRIIAHLKADGNYPTERE